MPSLIFFPTTNTDIKPSDVCSKHGKCISKKMAHYCQCEPNYTGAYCQNYIDPCRTNPCFHGGSCVPTNESPFNMLNVGPVLKKKAVSNGYECMCVKGYEGMRCEEKVDVCISNPCLNGGICTSNSHDFACSCLVAFSGPRYVRK